MQAHHQQSGAGTPQGVAGIDPQDIVGPGLIVEVCAGGHPDGAVAIDGEVLRPVSAEIAVQQRLVALDRNGSHEGPGGGILGEFHIQGPHDGHIHRVGDGQGDGDDPTGA